MRKHFAYIRVSTAKQGERGSSLQEQRAAIEAYAMRQNLTITAWFEERETAAKQGRAVFSRMLARLARGEAQGLVIHKIDRSARNLKDWADLGSLIDQGIDVQFAHDSFDLRSRGGRLSADIQAVVAADYIRNLRDEVRKGFYGRLKQGFYPLPAPIGYLDMGGGRVKEIDPVRGPLVREAFELYSSGKVGLRALRTEMAKRGLRTKSGKTLSRNSLNQTLHSPFYIGLLYISKTGETFEGKHEPLVTKATFDRVQMIMRGKTIERKTKHDFVFRRLARCGGCSRYLIGELQKGRYVYYRCQNSGCRGTIAREEALEHAVMTTLELVHCGPEERSWIREKAVELRENSDGDLAKLEATLRLQLSKCEDRLARLTDALIDQTIDKDLFENRKRALLEERAGLRDDLASLSAADLPISQALNGLELASTALLSYKRGIPDERRAIIESVTSNLALHGKNLEIALRSPFRELANWRKLQIGPPRRSSIPESAAQVLDIFLAHATASRSAAIEQNKAHIKKAA